MKFENTYSQLGHKFCAPQLPTPVHAPKLIKFNDELAKALGIEFIKENAAQLLSGNEIIEGSKPIAQAYAGHQFGHLNILGDGRAILLCEIPTSFGLYDMVLKGAGRTKYSRGGDGRAGLGPVMREYIISEAMNNLNIPTTRALSFILSGEDILRENFEQGAILTRIAKSHIRVGTFTYFSMHRDYISLKKLADFVINRHYNNAKNYCDLLRLICINQAKLIAKWLSIGFIHGVMNTDNMAISGETLDYGPCAFLDEYDSAKWFSFIDKRGRYQYQNQPNIAIWNLARLAEALLPILHEEENKALEIANEIIGDLPNLFKQTWLEEFGAKIGIEDEALINGFLQILQNNKLDFTNSFRELANQNLKIEIFGDWLFEWEKKVNFQKIRANLLQANPQIIPRNHHIIMAIKAGENGDFSIMERLIKAYAKPFEFNNEFTDLYLPPHENERVINTFCGT